MQNNKNQQLGMTFGKAASRLKKSILFSLVIKPELNKCFRCGDCIDNEKDLSVDHKEPWLHSENPVDLFFSLENIAFSHTGCNSKAARRTNRKYATEEERLDAERKLDAAAQRKRYTPEKRRRKYLEKGY